MPSSLSRTRTKPAPSGFTELSRERTKPTAFGCSGPDLTPSGVRDADHRESMPTGVESAKADRAPPGRLGPMRTEPTSSGFSGAGPTHSGQPPWFQ